MTIKKNAAEAGVAGIAVTAANTSETYGTKSYHLNPEARRTYMQMPTREQWMESRPQELCPCGEVGRLVSRPAICVRGGEWEEPYTVLVHPETVHVSRFGELTDPPNWLQVSADHIRIGRVSKSSPVDFYLDDETLH